MIRTTRLLCFAVLIFIMAFALPQNTLRAQDGASSPPRQLTAGDDFQPITDTDIQMMRKDIRSQRKQIIAANMKLTDTEAEKFWPIYEQYVAELVQINGAKYNLVKQYVQTGGALTDEQADSAVTQWMGSSRGHWEGNALVVETTNFNGQASMTSFPTRGSPKDPRATSTQLKLVERFERTDEDHLTYTVTVTDPVTQVTSWTARSLWRRDDSYQFYEYACHEDNYDIVHFLSGARAREKAAQTK